MQPLSNVLSDKASGVFAGRNRLGWVVRLPPPHRIVRVPVNGSGPNGFDIVPVEHVRPWNLSPPRLQLSLRRLAPEPSVGHLLCLRWAVRVAYVPQQAVDCSQFALELFLSFDPLEAFAEP